MKVLLAISFLCSFSLFSQEIILLDTNPKKKKQEGEPIYTIVEKQAQFQGGKEAMEKFIKENFKYPENALKYKDEGTVFIQIVVEKDGKISDAKIMQGVISDLDKEALRVVKSFPKWIPGEHKGKVVRTNYMVAVKCELPKEK